MKKAIKKVKGFLGRVVRDLERQVKAQGLVLSDKQQVCLRQAKQLLAQTRNSKNKLYSLHEPGVDCISKVRREVAKVIVLLRQMLQQAEPAVPWAVAYRNMRHGQPSRVKLSGQSTPAL